MSHKHRPEIDGCGKDIYDFLEDEPRTVAEMRQFIEGYSYSQIVNGLHSLVRRGLVVPVGAVHNGQRNTRYVVAR